MHRLFLSFTVVSLFLSTVLLPAAAWAQPQGSKSPHISGGAEAAANLHRVADQSNLQGSPVRGLPGVATFFPGVSFLAYNYDDNVTLTNGWQFIPPDPCGAAGTDRVIAVTNVGIECRNKTGTLLYRDSLQNFFSSLSGTLGTFTFDPKIVYDHYENRFVVVTLERWFVANGDPADASRILVAVSKTSTPATATSSDWWYMVIDSNVNIGGTNYWADYPGFEVDEEAVYITNNLYDYTVGGYGGLRLWIIDKGVVGGFYAGGTPAWNIYNPIPPTFFDMTMMPALVFGPGGADVGATNVGTYLVGYSNLTSGGPGGTEWVQIVRVDNPLGATFFTGQWVQVGDLEDVGGIYGFPALPDAPQLGSAITIETNDGRALDAVWRSGHLWFTTTINPNAANDPVNTGQATAHWFRLDTSVLGSITLADQGNIGAEDLGPNTFTYFPAVAVNKNNAAKFGFAASSETIYAGAYYAGREATDPLGSVQPTQTVQAGLDWYWRQFNGTRNRWGDYSGAAVDPTDDTTFWIYNEYAEVRGTPWGTPTQDGRWGTAWASCLQQTPTDFGDCPDPGYQTLLASNGARHTIVQGVFMGAQIDPEPDGQPHPQALGDDLNNLPDEDGMLQVLPFIPGAATQIDVTVSTSGWVDVWIDFDLDGTFTAADLMWSNPVAPGLNNLIFNVPAYAAPLSNTFMRVRYNLNGPLQPFGSAPDGEVEDYEVFVDELAEELDFGDAPDPTYRTLLASNGARHTIVQGVLMGAQIDAEPDGQPNPTATGDDINNLADEDGVGFPIPFNPGQPTQVDVSVSVSGWVDVWIDFDLDGVFTAADLMWSGAVGPGLNPLNFNVPGLAIPGSTTYCRVRFNTVGALTPDGHATDGEVEDYEVHVEEEQATEDFGDAPTSYPTLLASNGARHTIVPGVFLGAQIDAELDGQPNATATGDDIAALNDEDGVSFVTNFAPGSPAQIDVVASVPGWVDMWIDFDGDGDFDGLDLIYSGGVGAGNNPIPFMVPYYASPGTATYCRVRYNTGGALPPDGPAQDGEVEDYEIVVKDVENMDFGDAPDPTYPTLLINDGARHTIIAGTLMGAQIDSENNGQPNANATGDDLAVVDDEDGVTWITPLVPGSTAQVDVSVLISGFLDAWVDFNLNGTWDHPSELIYSGPVNAGLNNIFFPVPAGIASGQSFARFRYNTSAAGLLPTGYASDGEVEDYDIDIEEAPQLDFGDAPDPTYQTLLVSNGARHPIVQGIFMGAVIDGELDGQPNANATGDDLAGAPNDEDGVLFVSPFVPGSPAQIDVVVSAPGFVDIWIDFDLDGVFTGVDQVYSSPVVPGLNPCPFMVPLYAVSGTMPFARVRYNTVAPLPPDGLAIDGEVEDYQIFVDEVDLDFGDAPDPTYPTLLVNDGARHQPLAGVFMGALLDSEPDGQPNANATGDDLAGSPDEDGVVFVTGLVQGAVAQIDVTVSVSGWLDAWIDFDQNGVFDHPAELIYSGGVSSGLNSLFVPVPAGAPAGPTFSRFRYNVNGSALMPTGYSPDGEVEDYHVTVDQPSDPTEDFGDCPDPSYRTLLANNGPRHTIVPGVFLGAVVDAEFDGQPTANADGDDLAGSPDEDGVIVVTPFVPGSPAQIDVVASVPGWVDAWIDFDMDGVFTAVDLVYSGPVNPGINSLFFSVPLYALPGSSTYMRVRYNTGGALPPDGPAQDGEVEDYFVFVDEVYLDFGDAPDPSYPTLLISDGARHLSIPGVFMGNLIDSEPDGQPDPTATGDDIANLPDEDGVVFLTPLIPGSTAQVDVTVSVNGWLDAWIDFDQSGMWDHPAELIYSGIVNAGLNNIVFSVPAGIPPGPTFARFRYNINGVALLPTGYSPDGEVEDYQIDIEPEPEPIEDFGDAPDPTYQTLLASNGARHFVVPGVMLGTLIDAELDGQPDATATGDDFANLPDEDGVVFLTPLIPGQPCQIDVFPSIGGWVDIWIDLDGDGVFTPADQVWSNPVVPGPNSAFFTLPGLSVPGPSFARIRYNTAGPLPPDGPAGDGEVEDYEVFIEDPALDFGDAPDAPYPVLLASNGARHVIVPGVFMGNLIDAEPDGLPTGGAVGDDLNNLPDEDGVVFMTPITAGGTPQVDVTVSVAGWMDIWFDLNYDGVWAGGDLVYSGPVSAGLNQLLLSIPAGTSAGNTYARFRYNLGGALPPDGMAGDGEVEDYEIHIQTVTGLPGDTGTFRMAPATPNPFLHLTTVHYEIPSEEHVVIQVFTLSGRQVATLVDQRLPAGAHQAEWRGVSDGGESMPSGVYFLRFKAGSKTFTQRVIFIK